MRFRLLFKDVAVYGAGDILLRGAAFITMPIYTRIFSPEEYGVWSFIVTLTGLASSLLILGGDSAYSRFFFASKTIGEKQVITSTMLGFLALWSLLIVLLCLPLTGFFSQWSFGTGQYNLLFFLSLLLVPLFLINSICGQVLRNQFKARLFVLLNILSTFLTVGLSLTGVLVLDLGLVGVIGGGLAAAAIMLPIRLWTARAMLRPTFSAKVLRGLLAYGIPLVPASIAYWIFAASDRVVLTKLSTLDQLGLYAVANGAVSIMGLANSALGQAWSPHAIRVYEEEPEVASVFFGQVLTYILIVFGCLGLAITIFARELLMVLTTPAFYPAAAAIGPLALGFVAYASTQITASGISITKKTKYFALFSWISALLNLGLNILLVPKWGMMATSWTTAGSYIFLTTAYLIVSQRLWHIVYEKERSLIVAALTFVFIALVPLLPNLSLLPSLALKSACFLLYLGSLFIFHVLGRHEINAAVAVLRSLRVRRIGDAV